ncbi:porin [Sulfurimonas paralvinellae]|uniref:Porin n=1 Tax=Sulfurimonas paralvinellae TaxID=317658 RepID=A0A7M1B632_9BACT|nr:porin [Sulfurimonas paralvinellae]QOP45120.1 porin [Sulfurimonas paralvinellae]
MKFTKMSLVAALLIGSSAFAIDNVKVSGDAKLYYNTQDNDYSTPATRSNNDLFASQGAAGQAALGLGITADLAKNVSAGVHTTVLTTLGLQGQLVNNVWEGTNGLTDSWIVDEAWVAGTVGKTTGKIGRMKLDTPLVFSETWSIVENTFEAAVVINQDVPDTTLVGAYVGGSNAANAISGNANAVPGVGIANRIQTIASESTFSQFYNGAYAAGVVNNSFKPLTAQAWYYDAPQYVDAFWLQADLAMEGVVAGAQYTKINYNKSNQLAIAKDTDNDVYAFKLGYEMKDVAAISVAYSQTGKETVASLGAGENLATLGNKPMSKLYTEAWWNYGYVTRADTSALNVTVTGKAAGIDLGAYYTQTDADKNGGTVDRADMKEFTVTAGKDFGPLNTTLAYVYTKADDQNQKTAAKDGDAYNAIQAYLTLNF